MFLPDIAEATPGYLAADLLALVQHAWLNARSVHVEKETKEDTNATVRIKIDTQRFVIMYKW